MPPRRSVEVETVARRALQAALNNDFETLRNLMSSDPSLRVLGSDSDEWWKGPAEFFSVRETVVEELPTLDFKVSEVEAFEEGGLAWATIFSSVVTPETTTRFRQTAVFRIESGVWRVIQWHNSAPVANQEVIGVELTKTLGNLVTSVLAGDRQMLSTSGNEGTMTLVFTDIVDSTPLAEALGDERWTDLVAKLESKIEAITASHHGHVVKFLGDGSMLAFESARSAVRAAVDIQKAKSYSPYSLRIGVHTGEVQQTASDIFGLTVNKAARVAAAGDAGEVIVSSISRDLIGTMDTVEFGEPRTVSLKGLSETHRVLPVSWT